MSTVRCLPNSPIDATTALEIAKNADLSFVVIMGWSKSGELYLGGTDANEIDLIYIFRKAEHAVLAGDD